MSRAALPKEESWARLQDRAKMLAAARHFFSQRGVVEVDCPACVAFPSLDAYIDPFTVEDGLGERRYLHTSPEYAMKRLLAAGSGDIYQLGHVFRASEVGSRHNPEFTMAEWYRCGFNLTEMIAETAAFAMLFVGLLPCRTLSYRQAMLDYAGIDYVKASHEQLLQCVQKLGLAPSEQLSTGSHDDLLNLIMGTAVEPHLGKGELTAINEYPATQSALAEKTLNNGIAVACRFEVYYQGYELANGYSELRDATEQRQRFSEANTQRRRTGKEELPLDERFLECLKTLPSCCGVAVGFDRLMMLRHPGAPICEILPLAWNEA